MFSSLLCCICCAGTGACSVSCPLRSYFIGVPLGLRSLENAVDSLGIEGFCIAVFPLIYLCNGKRYIKGHKYFFYLIYPVHMLILLLLRYLLLFLL